MLITLPMPPVSTNHGYHTSGGRWYKDKKLADWEEECLWLLKNEQKMLQEEYTVRISFYFGNKRKNDIDGRIKPVLDLFQKAGFYPDDSLVVVLVVNKLYDKERPRLEVEVS